jgi:hypothetical protein
MLCRHKRGNKATYTCPFHGWTFNNSGKLLKVKDVPPRGARSGSSGALLTLGTHRNPRPWRFPVIPWDSPVGRAPLMASSEAEPLPKILAREAGEARYPVVGLQRLE